MKNITAPLDDMYHPNKNYNFIIEHIENYLNDKNVKNSFTPHRLVFHLSNDKQEDVIEVVKMYEKKAG